MSDDLATRVAQATGSAVAVPEDPTGHASTLAWLDRRAAYIEQALPKHVDAGTFVQAALSCMENLRGCEPVTIQRALFACARFGLMPDGIKAAIVPYGKVAQFQPMSQGYIDLMYRSRMVDSIRVDMIREKDVWDYEPTAPPPGDFRHKPRVELPADQRGEEILAYAYAWLGAGCRSQVILLNRGDAEQIRDQYSKAYARAENNNKRNSTWHTEFPAMWRKSCVRRLAKVVPTSPEVVQLMRLDDQAEIGAPQVYDAEVLSMSDGIEGEDQ